MVAEAPGRLDEKERHITNFGCMLTPTQLTCQRARRGSALFHREGPASLSWTSVSEHLRRADVCAGGEQRQHAEFGKDRSPTAAEADELVQRIHRPTGRHAVSNDLQCGRHDLQWPAAS